MKPIVRFAMYFLIPASTFCSCKKETTPIIINQPPIANAGPDVSVSLLSCRDKSTSIELDGSGSSDPDGNIVSYSWAVISGTPGFFFSNAALPTTSVGNLSLGVYTFELTVKDAGGLSSKDTVGIVVKSDLDITVTSSFSFLNNYNDPWDYGAPSSDGYYDLTEMMGKVVIPPLGEFNIYINEYADTAELSDNIIESYVQISQSHVNVSPLYIVANPSINFKKLIRQGGGPFNGTFTVTSGSAQQCDVNVFTNLPPLSVTGNLDVSTRTITLRIKGKVYF